MCLLSRRFAPCRVDRLIWHAGSCNKQRRGVGHIGTHGKAKLWWGGDRFLSCPDHKKYIYIHIYTYVIYYNIFSKGQMKRSILNQGFCFFVYSTPVARDWHILGKISSDTGVLIHKNRGKTSSTWLHGQGDSDGISNLLRSKAQFVFGSTKWCHKSEMRFP
jgi:hypothetical protein